METRYCSNCGSQISKEAKFCPSCGTAQVAHVATGGPVYVVVNQSQSQSQAQSQAQNRGCGSGCIWIFVILVILGIIGGASDTQSTATHSTPSSTSTTQTSSSTTSPGTKIVALALFFVLIAGVIAVEVRKPGTLKRMFGPIGRWYKGQENIAVAQNKGYSSTEQGANYGIPKTDTKE